MIEEKDNIEEMEEIIIPKETKLDYGILTNRPEGMDYKEYKAIRKYQKKAIKQYLKGTLVDNQK